MLKYHVEVPNNLCTKYSMLKYHVLLFLFLSVLHIFTKLDYIQN